MYALAAQYNQNWTVRATAHQQWLRKSDCIWNQPQRWRDSSNHPLL